MRLCISAGSGFTRVALLLLVLAGLSTGCANLEAIGRFARTSAVVADNRQIIRDYAEAPQRQMRFTPVSRQDPLKAESAARKKQQTRLLAAQAILVDYLLALGDLAADKLPRTDPELGSLRRAVSGLPFFKDDESRQAAATASAAEGVATVISSAVLDHWRQARLNTLITESDPHVQALIAGLKEIVLVDFDMAVSQEKEATWKVFQKLATSAQSMPEVEGLPTIAALMWNERADDLEARRARLKSYAAALQKIADGHADLAKNTGQLSGEQLAERLEADVRDILILSGAIEALNE